MRKCDSVWYFDHQQGMLFEQAWQILSHHHVQPPWIRVVSAFTSHCDAGCDGRSAQSLPAVEFYLVCVRCQKIHVMYKNFEVLQAVQNLVGKLQEVIQKKERSWLKCGGQEGKIKVIASKKFLEARITSFCYEEGIGVTNYVEVYSD